MNFYSTRPAGSGTIPTRNANNAYNNERHERLNAQMK